MQAGDPHTAAEAGGGGGARTEFKDSLGWMVCSRSAERERGREKGVGEKGREGGERQRLWFCLLASTLWWDNTFHITHSQGTKRWEEAASIPQPPFRTHL